MILPVCQVWKPYAESFSGAPVGAKHCGEDYLVSSLFLVLAQLLVEYTLRLRRLREWELPEWRDQNFPNLFLEGLRALLILLAYVGVPLFAGWLLSEIVELLTFDLLGIVSHFPLAFAGFVAPFLFLSGIHSYLSDGLFSDAWQIRTVITNSKKFVRLAIPVIAFLEFFFWLSLCSLSFFLGLWVLLAYS